MIILQIVAGIVLVAISLWGSLGFVAGLGETREMRVFGRPIAPWAVSVICAVIAIAAVAGLTLLFDL